MPCHLSYQLSGVSGSWILQNSLGYKCDEDSVGLVGYQIEEPVDALDKDKSGERVVMYVFVIVCEMGSNDDEKSLSNR